MILIVNCGSKKTPEIAKNLILLDVHSHTIYLNEIHSADIYTYKGIIISGAPILLTQTPYNNFIELIRPLIFSTLPVLGICFGHQLIGLSFGSNISRCKENRTMQNIHIHNTDNLFNGFANISEFNEDHCECIDLPEEFILLASSYICINEAMKHKNLPLYGVQFHPETSGKNGLLLFKNFINICKTNQFNKL